MAADKFFIYYLVVNLTGLCASSVAFAISAGIRVTAVGNLLVVVLFVVSIVRRWRVTVSCSVVRNSSSLCTVGT